MFTLKVIQCVPAITSGAITENIEMKYILDIADTPKNFDFMMVLQDNYLPTMTLFTQDMAVSLLDELDEDNNDITPLRRPNKLLVDLMIKAFKEVADSNPQDVSYLIDVSM